MRKVLIGLGLAGALALGFGKTTTARADDNTPSSESAQGAADKAQGAADRAQGEADKAQGAAKSAGDQADKAANSASDATKSAGEATDKAAKQDSADHKADMDKTKGMNICITTTARTDAEGLALLRTMGMPFRQ